MIIHSERKLKICSILTALYLCLFYINSVIKINGIGYVTVFGVILACFFALAQRQVIVYREWILIIIYILFIYCLSIFRLGLNSFTFDYLLHFLSFGVIGVLLGMQETRVKYIVKYIVIIGLIGMPRILYFYGNMLNDSDPVVMGVVYAMLPVLLSSFIGWLYNYKYKIAGLILGIEILFLYFKIGSRGVIVASGVFIIWILYYQIYVKKRKTDVAIMPIVLVIIALCLGIFFFLNITDVVKQMVSFLETYFGVHIYALDKILFYSLVKEDILNGRGELWVNAWKMAGDHIIIGNGIGYYEIMNGSYPHNFVLQAIDEAGLLFICPLIIVILRILVWLLFSRANSEKYYFVSLLFVSGIMPLLFSSSYWYMNPFWYFLGYTIKRLKGNQVNLYAIEERKQSKSSGYSWRTSRI